MLNNTNIETYTCQKNRDIQAIIIMDNNNWLKSLGENGWSISNWASKVQKSNHCWKIIELVAKAKVIHQRT